MTNEKREQIFKILMRGTDPRQFPELAEMNADDVNRMEPLIDLMVLTARIEQHQEDHGCGYTGAGEFNGYNCEKLAGFAQQGVDIAKKSLTPKH